jgi:predicted ATPase/DNA-binding SARP family transcriptional activator
VQDEIRVLGPLELIGEHGRVTLGAAKERRLLAALVAEVGKTRSSESLTDAIWGGAPPRSASKLLQVYVSKLRKRLPASAGIRTRGSGYALELDDGMLDSARFERLLEEARGATRAGNPNLAASILGRALALWSGEAYGELADEDFVRAEARRLEELRLVALEERFVAELALGRDAELLAELRRLADSHPLRERLQAQLMLALYRSGRQSEALDHFAATRRHLHDELGLEPGAELRDLQRRILRHDPTLAVAPGSGRATSVSLPTPLGPLLGREIELAEIADLLRRDDVRLLVLSGAGGSGKTRLALEAARQNASSFANGAVLVELAPVHDPALVLGAISNALRIEQLRIGHVGGDPLEAVAAALRSRELLLLLDNFEHLREAAPILVDLVSQAPHLTVLVTSRVVLHLSGEHVYPVEPLDEDAAVALFAERTREADARFDSGGAEEAIREICRRVDRLPLAIELAARRIRSRTPAELLAGLELRLPLLTGGPRDLPARQQTLRGTIEWSFDILDELERRDVTRLSVFAGGCTFESAEAVCETTLERLSALVDHNLVVRTSTSRGSRYSMLETIRELASELLESAGEADAVRARHAARMLAIAEAAHLSEDDDEPYDQPAALVERDDLRIALDWAAERDVILGLELASALENFWGANAPVEGMRRLGQLLDRGIDIPPLLRARALRNLAGAAHQERAWDVADPAYEESLVICTELGDDRGAALILTRLAYRARENGEPDRARALIDDSERVAGGRFLLTEAQNALLLSYLALGEGRLDDAEAALGRSRELADRLSWRWWEAAVHNVSLTVALQRGDLDAAERYGRAALAINVEDEYVRSTGQSIVGLAVVALARDDLERAGVLWGAVSTDARGMGPLTARWAGELRLRGETEPAFLDAVERGRHLRLEEVAAIALAADETESIAE